MTNVLLIEDDDQTADEIVAELVHRGFHVEWAATGTTGLEKPRAAEQDVIIVDRLLPEIDGLTIVETLRRSQVRTPVLVLSALGAVDDRVRGLRAGGDDYLAKPFALVGLMGRPRARLRRPAPSRGPARAGGPVSCSVRLPDFVRTTTFRWTAGTFVVCIFLFSGFVYWQTAAYMTTRIDDAITGEAVAIAAEPPERRLAAIEDRLVLDPRRINLAGLVDGGRTRVAGTLASCPPRLEP